MAIAEVLTFPTDGVDCGPSAPDLLATILGAADKVETMTATAGLAICAQAKQRFDAVEAALLARVITNDDGDDRRARRMARRKGSSKHQQRKLADRAKAVATNPALGDRLEDGTLSIEELDLLTGVAAKSDDDALFDNDLINQLGAAGPDQGKRVVRNWLQNRQDRTTAEERYRWQRKMRSARRWDTKDGLAAITVEGDDATIDAIWNQVTAGADRLYRLDGGRDTPAAAHPRTYDHRLFDALVGRWNPDGTTAGSGNVRPGRGGASSGTGSTTTGNGVTGTRAPQTPAPGSAAGRPTVVVTVTLDMLTGNAPEEAGCQIGTGPIADAVLARYLQHGDLVGLLFDTRGQPLWLGRKRRDATAAQHLALTVRDRGCVLCGTAAHQCQSHHLIPWHAPSQGTTDIDQLALLCGSCHRNLHQDKRTLEWADATRVWTTRPATACELPPTWSGAPQRE